MKLTVTVTPQIKAITDTAVAWADVLAALGINARSGARVECEIRDPDTPSRREAVERLCREMNERFAAWPRHAAGIRLEVAPGSAPAAADIPPVPARRSVAPVLLEKLRDFNGSGAQAALPKVLEVAARHAIEVEWVNANTEKRETWVLARAGGGRFCELDPARGAAIETLERLRDLACAGAAAVGLVDRVALAPHLSVEDFDRWTNGVRGLAETAGFFGLPVVATEAGLGAEAEPAAAIAAVTALGVVAEGSRLVQGTVGQAGENLMLLGEVPSEIGSCYLEAVHELRAGEVPRVDFAAEKRLGEVLQTLIHAGVVLAARSVAEGGLLVTISRMLFAREGSFGARVDVTSLGGTRADALLFGESQGCIVLAVAPDRVGTVLSEAHMRGVSAALIGEVTAEATLDLKTRSLATTWAMDELRRSWASRP